MRQKEDTKQRQTIQEFDSRLHSYTSNGMEPVEKLVAIFGLFFLTMTMLIPFGTEDDMGLVFSMASFNIMPVVIYVSMKQTIKEGGKNKSICQKLKYIPVSKEAFRRERVENVINFQKKILFAGLVAQLVGAWAFTGRIGIWNFIYPIVAQGVIPMGLGILSIMSDTNVNDIF